VTVILGAMDGEIDAIRRHIDAVLESDWCGNTLYSGTILSEEVVVCRTGVGKTLSAMVCQHLIHAAEPDRVLFTGVAGSLDPELEIGDTVIAADCIQHDMDATPLGFAPGEIPYSDTRVITCDPDLVAAALRSVQPHGSQRVGRILTGDQFISSPELRASLRERFGGDCVEMEGASVALVCATNSVPCLLVRTISDHADGTVDFQRAIASAAENAWLYVRTVIDSLHEET
jgi:adenosylhomocysteine nucleosidase